MTWELKERAFTQVVGASVIKFAIRNKQQQWQQICVLPTLVLFLVSLLCKARNIN